MRLDLYLVKKQGISRKQAKRLLDQGLVQVGGRKVVIASWEVEKKDKVEIQKEATPPPATGYYLKVLHEDKDLLVVEKEAGTPCEKSSVATTPTMVAIINEYLKRTQSHLKHHYLGLVHRLDQDTSGIMVYTKTKEANKIIDQFKRHTIRRKYLALVVGQVKKERDKIEGFLQKSPLLKGGKKVKDSTPESGRYASTEYSVVERYPQATLVEVKLNTGRTHQIRFHLASIGHPVVGDKIYIPHPRPLPQGERGLAFPRQALHAHYLCFHHPVTGEKMEFSSDLPKDMRKLVDRLRLSA